MTPTQQQQLARLQEEQRVLRAQVAAFDERLRDFAAGMEQEATPVPEAARKPVDLVLPVAEEAIPLPPAAAHTPPPLPREPLPVEEPVLAPSTPPLPPRADPTLAPTSGSWEMTLGTVWLARIGIVILLTGFVFLGNYAWQHIVHTLDPAGKLSLLALAGVALMALGGWLRRGHASLGRYAQILLAGGAATLYYTAYAAHFVRPLRVIESPWAGGLLLLAVAGLLLWWSDRRRLPSAALIAIGLAYYTSAINPVGQFTLYSSVLLTAAAGFLLVRHGWALVSWVSLAGTYLSYGFWRYQAERAGSADPPPWGVALALLAVYWVLFTASVFRARREALPAARRATFLTLNNGLFFALASQHLLATRRDDYWAFALGYGVVLLGLAVLARYWSEEDFALDGAYLVQGIAGVTTGLALKLSGTSLAVALVVESGLLLAGAARRHGIIYRLGAALLAGWSFHLTVREMDRSPERIIPLGGTVAALLLLDAWWLKLRSGWLAARRWSWQAAWFAALGLALIGLVLFQEVHAPWEPAALALAAVAAAASIYLLWLPEVALLGQLFLALAVADWELGFHPHAPWGVPLTVVLTALALAHWWQRQCLFLSGNARDLLQLACASALVVTGTAWLHLFALEPSSVMMAAAVAALLTLFYGSATRLWALALVGQGFLLLCLAARFELSPRAPQPGELALLPILATTFGGLIFAAGDQRGWPAALRRRTPVLALVYWLGAAALLTQWISEYIPLPWRSLAYMIVGSLLLLLSARWPRPLRLYTGLAFFAIGLLQYLFAQTWSASWQNLLALLLIPATLRLGALLTGGRELLPPHIRHTFVGLATAAVWLWVTRWMHTHQQRHLLTLAWSALAVIVFAAGLLLRDRVYRLGGFLILALALGRIFFVDVWQLETIFRILSFLGLGLVLLVLGFVYNRYADRIQRWL